MIIIAVLIAKHAVGCQGKQLKDSSTELTPQVREKAKLPRAAKAVFLLHREK